MGHGVPEQHRRSWLNKVNYIVRFLVNPCTAPVVVYVELAAVPLGDAIITWFTFGLLDVVRGAVRPNEANRKRPRRGKGKGGGKGKNGGRTRFSGRGGWRNMPGLGDDTGGWLGKQLPGAKQFKGRKTNQLERFLWMVDDVGQRALFAIMVGSIITDGLYDWFSLLDESLYCQQRDAGGLVATGPASGCGGIIICNALNAPDVIWREGDCSWVVSTGHVGDGPWTLISGIKLKNASPFPVFHKQRILLNAVWIEGAGQTVPALQSFDSVFTIDIDGPAVFVLNHCCSPGFVVTDGSQDIAIFGVSSLSV